MKIRRFVAPDMRRAMRMVRDEQGPDAVILSNRRIEGGIEVVTAIDYDETLLKTSSAAAPASPAIPAAVADSAGLERAAESWSREPTMLGMKEEVASLRRLLESQLASLAWNDSARRHPVRAGVVRKLADLGLTPELAGSLADETHGDNIDTAFESALGLLEKRLPVLDTELIDQPGAIALVGPTGVGKTTSIAKLAARFALKHGADALSLLTTDSFRIGAQEQLLTFGRILGIPVQLVRDGDELRNALDAASNKKLVLIDSAGMSQRDQRINRELASLRDAGSRVRVVLTLSSHAQTAVLEEAVQAFGDLAPCASLLTKIDEAATIGGALSILIRHGLPLAYVTDGQNVPEDLHWARSRRLALIDRAAQLADNVTLPPASITSAHNEVHAHG